MSQQPHTGRLHTSSVEAEDPNGYASGRYFPVKLGDVFEHGRYRVFHKLGWGGYATVWLAKDITYVWLHRMIRKADRRGSRTNINVALKFSNTKLNSRELQILHHLKFSTTAQKYASHPGRHMVLELLDDFAVSSTHRCLVLNVMGGDLQSSIETERCRRLPRGTALSIARDVALGLDYLWKCNVAHGGE